MSTVVLPLRDPVILAKECATIDYLSEGRFLPMFGVGNDVAPDFSTCTATRSPGFTPRATSTLAIYPARAIRSP